jgi:hypothetical protein
MPSQSGLLIQGDVWRAVGSWVGNEMYVDFLLAPLPYTGSTSPASQNLPATTTVNLSFNWPKGTPMAAAINSTLQAAFPGTPTNVQINPGLVLGHDQIGIYSTMGAFADFINLLSRSILGPNNPQYFGISIAPRNGSIAVFDGSTDTSSASTAGTKPPQLKTVNILFTDLVGQPTWTANGVVLVTVIMRGDINIGDTVTLPESIATVGPGAINMSPTQLSTIARFSSQFQGNWTVRQVRHVGNYKSAQGTAWVTTLLVMSALGLAVPQNTPTTTPAGDE